MAFKRYDPEGTGFISSLDFNDIILSVKSHLLTPDVKANLIAVSRISYLSHLLLINETLYFSLLAEVRTRAVRSRTPISWPLLPFSIIWN